MAAIEAHAGFLNGAESLMPHISKILQKVVRVGRVKHVLFTGHSAGGSVASLLWLKFLCFGAKTCKSYPFHSFKSQLRNMQPRSLAYNLKQPATDSREYRSNSLLLQYNIRSGTCSPPRRHPIQNPKECKPRHAIIVRQRI
jgi:hypothetical protein